MELLLSDACYPIINAFYESFALAKQNVICWAHVARHVKDRIQRKECYPRFKADLSVLQMSRNRETFEFVANLLVKKYSNAEPEFCEYFDTYWIKRHQNWFGGYAPFAPATNNAIEGKNASIKTNYTLRERLPFNTFKIVFQNMVSDMSSKYSPDCGQKVKVIYNEPNLSIEDFQKALEWLNQKDNKILPIEEHYLVSSAKFKAMNLAETTNMKNLMELHSENFDDYKNNYHLMVYKVYIDKEKWASNSKCECIFFQKRTFCKHIIGLALTLKLTSCPETAKITTLPTKRKRFGPKAKAAPALKRQKN